jgi:hypothetical protein
MRILSFAAALGLLFNGGVMAAPPDSRLIAPPEFGVIREVVGADLMVLTPSKTCKPSDSLGHTDLCFSGVMPKLGETQRVLVLDKPLPGRLLGKINRDYRLFDVSLETSGLKAIQRELQSSDVRVPRECFSLKDEPVGYLISATGNGWRALESQIVSCDGGPREPSGPYRAEGPVLQSDIGGWRRTETLYNEGALRFLAVPDPACPPDYRVREAHCAVSAIDHLKTNPTLKEVDLIAAKGAVTDKQVLGAEGLMQWVLKRRTKGFKADGRWIEKSMLSLVDGCTGLEPLKWHVKADTKGYQISEKVLSQCGARLAPVPSAIYEVYGQDFFILNCSWSDRPEELDPGCKDQASDYLNRARKESGHFVVISDRYRAGDRVFDGGYIRYSFVFAELTPMDVRMKSTSLQNIYGVNQCVHTSSGRGDNDGFIIVNGGGILWARRYQHMSCTVY